MMVLKPAKFPGANKGSRPGKRSPSIELTKPIRPVLQSLEIPTLLEKERSSAFFNQLFKPGSMQREFSSYYLSSTTKSPGSYLLTSHENPTPIQPPVISAYNSLVKDFQWDPYVESTKIVINKEAGVTGCEENSGLQESSQCEVYNSKYESPTKCFSPLISNPRTIFKDNIMKFSDQGTMTPHLNNACCGSRTPVFPTSDASVSSAHIAFQESPENIPIHSYVIPHAYVPQEQRVREYPPPILKKSVRHPFQSKYDKYITLEALTDMDADRDVDPPNYPASDYESRIGSKKSCYDERGGKVLYNEGIDDSIKQNYHLPMRLPLPANVRFDRSKVEIGKCYSENENEIPYSHRYESKYHSACMESSLPHRRHIDGDRKIISNSKMPRSYPNGMNQYKTQSGPKRVLPSDQDIDTFIEINVPKLVVPKRKK